MPRKKPVRQRPDQQDFVECQICHKKLAIINNWHLQQHDITLIQYKQMFPSSNTCSQTTSFKVSCSTRGKKRPEFRELSVMIFLDMHPEVDSWSYEPFCVPYIDWVGKKRTYTPDFLISIACVNEVWEVKPEGLTGHCENIWNKIYALEENNVQKEFGFEQVAILTEKEIEGLRNFNWRQLYQSLSLPLTELEEREKDMAENVKINDIYYRGEK